jgi:hypothetical protein
VLKPLITLFTQSEKKPADGTNESLGPFCASVSLNLEGVPLSSYSEIPSESISVIVER